MAPRAGGAVELLERSHSLVLTAGGDRALFACLDVRMASLVPVAGRKPRCVEGSRFVGAVNGNKVRAAFANVNIVALFEKCR